MIHLFLLAFGVLNALLCHWMVRNTYEGFEFVPTEEKDRFGRVKQKKEWVYKLKMPRWIYFVIWAFCILLPPVSFVATLIMAMVIIGMEESGHFKFICTNRFIEWLNKEV